MSELNEKLCKLRTMEEIPFIRSVVFDGNIISIDIKMKDGLLYALNKKTFKLHFLGSGWGGSDFSASKVFDDIIEKGLKKNKLCNKCIHRYTYKLDGVCFKSFNKIKL